MHPVLSVLLLCLAILTASPLAAQTTTPPRVTPNSLKDLSASVEALTTRVSASVVQVLVTGYGPVDDGNGDGPIIGRQRGIGSGAIIDADGYIITNAHVVAGARRVQVVLHGSATTTDPVSSLAADVDKIVAARIVGVAADIDLALLKVDVTNLRPIPLADYDAIRQGELVFAFGSPEGLRNSVTMGVVSSVARQPDPDSTTIYVQTDAPINPGNSGGPLVNVDGELVGVNTFILSESGGSQGLGFAIPSAVVAAAYPQLLRYGHLHRGFIGVSMQAITPALAAGLDLARTSGVMLGDVTPDSPAEAAGVAIGDVVSTINGKVVDSLPMMALELSRHAAGDVLTLGLIRGTQKVSASVTVRERPHAIDQLAALADPEKGTIQKLGIIGVDVGDATKPLLPDLRIGTGVLVAAHTEVPSGNDVPLLPGDVIHAVGRITVSSIDVLSVLLDAAKPDSELILQIERDGQLIFVTCLLY